MAKFSVAQRDKREPDQVTIRKPARGRKATKAKAVLDRPALPPGWLTSDDDEINLRRWRLPRQRIIIRLRYRRLGLAYSDLAS